VQKLKMQANEELAKVDMEKIKTQMEELKKTDFTKIEKEMKDLKPKIDAELGKAKLEIEKAKTELKEYKAFEDGLQQDGLINKDGAYTIEHKDGELIINGKVQPEAVYNKYKKFLDKHKKFKLKKDDGFDLDVN
jgi:metal-dependent hydrolase (beta-lactamase superfamily II)